MAKRTATETSEPKTRKFEVLAGVHYQHGKLYRGPKKPGERGDIVESAHDLSDQFVNKFREITYDPSAPGVSAGEKVAGSIPTGPEASNPLLKAGNAPKAATEPTEPTVPAADADDEDDDDKPGETSPQGTEVTDTFPEAVEQDFRVFKLNKLYSFFDADDLINPVGEGLARKDVAAAIKAAVSK